MNSIIKKATLAFAFTLATISSTKADIIYNASLQTEVQDDPNNETQNIFTPGTILNWAFQFEKSDLDAINDRADRADIFRTREGIDLLTISVDGVTGNTITLRNNNGTIIANNRGPSDRFIVAGDNFARTGQLTALPDFAFIEFADPTRNAFTSAVDGHAALNALIADFNDNQKLDIFSDVNLSLRSNGQEFNNLTYRPGTFEISRQTINVPEPSTAATLAILFGLETLRRRRRPYIEKRSTNTDGASPEDSPELVA